MLKGLETGMLKVLLKNFRTAAVTRGYTEDDVQEAIYLIIKRYGNDFLDGDAPLVMRYLLRALSEARRNNTPTAIKGKKGGSVAVELVDSIDEDIQPLVEDYKDLYKDLDKLLKRAKLSGEDVQTFYRYIRGDYAGTLKGRVPKLIMEPVGRIKDLLVSTDFW